MQASPGYPRDFFNRLLEGAAGVIPAASVDIKVVKCWYKRSQIRPGWHDVLVPELLLNDDSLVQVDLEARRTAGLKLSFLDDSRYVPPPDYTPNEGYEPTEEDPAKFPLHDSDTLQPFDLVGGQNKQLWITVHVPYDAPAGLYTGDLIFKRGAAEAGRFTLHLQVLPFELPAPKTRYDLSQDYTFRIYYRGQLDPDGPGVVGFRLKSEKQFRAEMRIMYEHGIVAPLMLLSGTFPRGVRPELLFRKHLQIMSETGMAGRPLYLGENVYHYRKEQLDQLRRDVADTVALAHEYGFTDVYFYGQDEAVGEVLRTKQLPWWRIVHESGGKVQTSVMYGSLPDTPDILDLVIAAQWPRGGLPAERHRLGHKIHSYSLPHTTESDPLIWRSRCGLYLWRLDYDGVTPYCFMHHSEGVWNDLDGRGPDYNIAYPTADGVVGTLALAGLREAADDVRYATLLMKRIERTRQNGSTAAKAVAEEAFQWIEQLDMLAADLDAVRAQVIDYISTLAGQ